MIDAPMPALTVLSFQEARERHAEFGAVISIENPEGGQRLRYDPDGPPQLVIQFDDLDHDRGDNFGTLPTLAQVEEALGFARRHADGALLVHCQAGKCRSTAFALAIIAERMGPGAEGAAVAELLAIRPVALPNFLALAHADTALGRGGRLVSAWMAHEDSDGEATGRRTRKTELHDTLRRKGADRLTGRIRARLRQGPEATA